MALNNFLYASVAFTISSTNTTSSIFAYCSFSPGNIAIRLSSFLSVIRGNGGTKSYIEGRSVSSVVIFISSGDLLLSFTFLITSYILFIKQSKCAKTILNMFSRFGVKPISFTVMLRLSDSASGVASVTFDSASFFIFLKNDRKWFESNRYQFFFSNSFLVDDNMSIIFLVSPSSSFSLVIFLYISRLFTCGFISPFTTRGVVTTSTLV